MSLKLLCACGIANESVILVAWANGDDLLYSNQKQVIPDRMHWTERENLLFNGVEDLPGVEDLFESGFYVWEGETENDQDDPNLEPAYSYDGKWRPATEHEVLAYMRKDRVFLGIGMEWPKSTYINKDNNDGPGSESTYKDAGQGIVTRIVRF